MIKEKSITPARTIGDEQLLETSNKTKTSLQPIFEMLDLFYAHKHMYDRLQHKKTKFIS